MKDRLRDLLAHQDHKTIVELAGRKRRILSFLAALTYDRDPLISRRALEAMGLAAARISDDEPEYVRVHLRRLMWLLNDESGGIGWRAPEMMGEIKRHYLTPRITCQRFSAVLARAYRPWNPLLVEQRCGTRSL